MDIIFQFGLPSFLGSDEGMAFMAKISQQVAKTPRIHENYTVPVDHRV